MASDAHRFLTQACAILDDLGEPDLAALTSQVLASLSQRYGVGGDGSDDRVS